MAGRRHRGIFKACCFPSCVPVRLGDSSLSCEFSPIAGSAVQWLSVPRRSPRCWPHSRSGFPRPCRSSSGPTYEKAHAMKKMRAKWCRGKGQRAGVGAQFSSWPSSPRSTKTLVCRVSPRHRRVKTSPRVFSRGSAMAGRRVPVPVPGSLPEADLGDQQEVTLHSVSRESCYGL